MSNLTGVRVLGSLKSLSNQRLPLSVNYTSSSHSNGNWISNGPMCTLVLLGVRVQCQRPGWRHDGQMQVRSFAVPSSSSSSNSSDNEVRDLEKDLSLEMIEKGNAKIAVLGMNRPKANPLSRNLLTRIQSYTEQLKFDRTVRAVILRSLVPGAFCAGADLKERTSMTNSEVVQHTIWQRAIVSGLADLPMPVIAAIDGYALGGGLELALACDLRVASASAKLGLVETRLGLIPGAGGTARLPRVVGVAKARELIYTARVLDGTQAEKIALVNAVVKQNDSGDAAYLKALEMAHEIAANGPIGVKMGKLSLSRGSEVDMNTALSIEEMCYAQVVPTSDRIEGLLAFKEKRKPEYTGE